MGHPRIAAFDGTSWTEMVNTGGLNDLVYALALVGSDIYVGGDFTNAGGDPNADFIARWDGSQWSALGAGISIFGLNNRVFALAVNGSDLYVGGIFQDAGAIATADNIARWNTSSSSWHSLGSGTDGTVRALAIAGSNLFAGGSFTSAGGNSTNYIARWNITNSTWFALGTGMDSTVSALSVDDNNLYVGGAFTTAGGISVNRIARWDMTNSAWHALGGGLNNWVFSLVSDGTDLYAGGSFTDASGNPNADYLARWDGSNWKAVGSGLNDFVLALKIDGSHNLIVGGFFENAGGKSGADHIARWDGTDWHALGSGVRTDSSSFKQGVRALLTDGSTLHIGGDFVSVGGLLSENIARANLPTNAAPAFDDDPGNDGTADTTLTINQDSPAQDIDSILAVTDTDNGDTLTWRVHTGPTNGSLGGFDATAASTGSSVQPSGLTYTPNGGYSGGDSFAISVSDGWDSDVMTVDVTVVANAQPVFALDANNDGTLSNTEAGGAINLTLAEDAGAFDISSLLGVDDPDAAQTLSWSVDGSDGADLGVINLSGTASTPASGAAPGTATYTPNTGQSGTDTFTIDVGDGNGGTDSLTISLTVTDAPDVIAVDITDGLYTAGDVIPVIVTFDEAVEITSGTPEIEIIVGSTTRTATYSSGAPGSVLTFHYTVQSGELDTDGIAIVADSLTGIIVDTDDGNTADLSHAGGVDAGATVDAGSNLISIEMVAVGDPGNPADSSTGYGAVAYEYNIGKYEVTNAQYVAFLNAVAATDTHDLYNSNMGTDPRGGIFRSETSGGFTYGTRPNMADKPVNFVSFWDMARFANWLTNGQPTGIQGNGTTEDGMYVLGGVTNPTTNNVTRQLDFSLGQSGVAIASEDEWYKAAYYQPWSAGGDGDGYWIYPTASNSAPTIAAATATGDVANPGTNVANVNFGADWNSQNGNVTTVGTAIADSYFGTFDQGGNVWELTDTISGPLRVLRGGAFDRDVSDLRASSRFFGGVPTQNVAVGFRVVFVEPTSLGINIPDTNLRSALEEALGLSPGAPITQAAMEGLTSLDLTVNGIADLTGLEYAINLTSLSIPGNSISDLAPLQSLTQLRTLIAMSNDIIDLTPLASLTELRFLILDSNPVGSLTPLGSLTNLGQLSVTSAGLTDLSGLETLTQLWFLLLSGNQITDLTPLQSLTGLSHLQLRDNDITDVTPLSGLSNLQYLDLSNNLVSVAAGLGTLTSLIELDVSGNLLSDISILAGLTPVAAPDFRMIWLHENLLTDVSPLAGLSQLANVNDPWFVSYPPDNANAPGLRLENNYIDITEGSTARTTVIDPLDALPDLTVIYAPQYTPDLFVSPSLVTFLGTPGGSYTQTLNLRNFGTGILDYEITFPAEATWLTIPQPNGSVAESGSSLVDLDFSSLPSFDKLLETTLTITTNEPGGTPHELPVRIVGLISNPNYSSAVGDFQLIEAGPQWRTEVRGGTPAGDVLVGTYRPEGGGWVPYFWDAVNGIRNAPQVPGATNRSSFILVQQMSEEAQLAVGRTFDEFGNLVPIVWSLEEPLAPPTILPLPDGLDRSGFSNDTLGRAFDISKDGSRISGQALNGSGILEGILWNWDENASVWTIERRTGGFDIVGANFLEVWPYEMSADGETVIGWVSYFDADFNYIQFPFLWTTSGIEYLPTPLNAESVEADLLSSDGGTVVGQYYDTSLNAYRLIVWNEDSPGGTWSFDTFAYPTGFFTADPESFINDNSSMVSLSLLDDDRNQWRSFIFGKANGFIPSRDWVLDKFGIDFGPDWEGEVHFANPATGLVFGKVTPYHSNAYQWMGFRYDRFGSLQSSLADAPFLADIPPDRQAPEDTNGPLSISNELAYALGLHPVFVTPDDMPQQVIEESGGNQFVWGCPILC